MKIKKIKINGFGKLNHKEIELKPHINIIYGNNETGKSTLLRFITGMFYGLSKNKNGQAVADIDKFEPWKEEEFSGKIEYELDSNEKFEVYRDFRKKNPKIFNQNLEDISKNFTIDKTKGNQFFYDQTGLEEEIFMTSVVAKQAEVKLDEKKQNSVIQKISNILGTGEDTTSYTKIVAKLKKKLNDEVGTNLTKEKPINIVEKRIQEIEKEKKELENYQEKQFIIDKEKAKKKEELIVAKENLATLTAAKMQFDKIKAEESKIEVVRKLAEGTKEEISSLKESYQEEQGQIKEKRKNQQYGTIGVVLLFIVSILCFILVKHIVIRIIPIVLVVLLGIILFLKNYKRSVEKKERKKDYQNKIKNLETIEKTQTEELEELEKNYRIKVEEIYQKYQVEKIELISEEINGLQIAINELTLDLHTIELDDKNISPKLEKLVNLEEEWESLLEYKKELEEKREEIKQVLEVLEISYQKMREEITPKFTDNLSYVINKISDGKYKKVRMNTSGKMLVETKEGEYIDAENLSIGTIDQLYLSLRLATIEEVSKEKMPIILDESFAYYDNERLQKILQYLSEEYQDRQVIIFTCTKREINALENIKKEYDLINL